MSAEISAAALSPAVEHIQPVVSSPIAVQPQVSREIAPNTAAQAAAAPSVAESATRAAQQLNEVMETFNKGIRFRMFENTGRMYVQIVNRHTQEVIRTIPPEELLRAMEKLHEVLGMILDARG